MKFGDNDLVYGPSAGGKLAELQNRLGGKLLGDLGGPSENGYSSWTEYSLSTLDRASSRRQAVHFDLTNVDDLNGVLNNTGAYANSVTAQELRYIMDNWGKFSNNVKLYNFNKGGKVGAPWIK